MSETLKDYLDAEFFQVNESNYYTEEDFNVLIYSPDGVQAINIDLEGLDKITALKHCPELDILIPQNRNKRTKFLISPGGAFLDDRGYANIQELIYAKPYFSVEHKQKRLMNAIVIKKVAFNEYQFALLFPEWGDKVQVDMGNPDTIALDVNSDYSARSAPRSHIFNVETKKRKIMFSVPKPDEDAAMSHTYNAESTSEGTVFTNQSGTRLLTLRIPATEIKPAYYGHYFVLANIKGKYVVGLVTLPKGKIVLDFRYGTEGSNSDGHLLLRDMFDDKYGIFAIKDNDASEWLVQPDFDIGTVKNGNIRLGKLNSEGETTWYVYDPEENDLYEVGIHEY